MDPKLSANAVFSPTSYHQLSRVAAGRRVVGWGGQLTTPLPGLPWIPLPGTPTERAQHPGLTAHPTHTFRELTVSTREVATVPGTWQSTAGSLLSPARGSALLDVPSPRAIVGSRTQLPRHEGLSACFSADTLPMKLGQALREALGSHRLHTSGTQTQATGDDSSDLTSVWALLPRPLPGRPAHKPLPPAWGNEAAPCSRHGGDMRSQKDPGAAAQQNTH